MSEWNSFSNIFLYMNFCKDAKLTSENSETYYNKETQKMYIRRI